MVKQGWRKVKVPESFAAAAPAWPRGVWVAVLCGWLLLVGWAALPPPTPEVTGSAELPATGYAVAVAGDRAYVAAGAEGLVIFDVSDPGLPREMGHYQEIEPYGVAVAGNFAYLAAGRAGLVVLAITDPAAPVEVGRLTLYVNLFRADARSVMVAGDRAYVGFGGKGNVRIVDISDPAQPVETSSVPASHSRGVAVAGELVWVCDGTGLMAWNVSSGSGTTIHFDNTAYGVAVQGRYAYVAAGAGGLLVVDVSDPDDWERFRVVKAVPTGGDARAVAVAGDYLYLADRQGGLRGYDLAEPAEPREVLVVGGESGLRAFTLAGGHAYLVDEELSVLPLDADGDGRVGSDDRFPDTALLDARWQGVAAVTLGVGVGVMAYNPALALARREMVRLGELTVRARSPLARGAARASPWAAAGLLVMASVAVLHDQTTWTTRVDVWYGELPASEVVTAGRPEVAVQRLAIPLPNEGNDVAVSGDYAYLAGNQALFVYNISDPARPLPVGSLDFGSSLKAVEVAGDYAFVTDWGGSKLWIIDISEPKRPRAVRSVNGISYARELTINNGLVYVTAWSGLVVIDISDPVAPRRVYTFNFDDIVGGVVVHAGYAYVAMGGALRVFDIADPTAPQEVGNYTTSVQVNRVAYYANHVYMTNWLSGFTVINVLDPTDPRRSAGFGPGTGFDVMVAGNYLYALGSSNGGYLKVLDLTDPGRPTEVALFDVWGDRGLAVAGGYAYIACGIWPCLQIVDISDPADPVSVGSSPCVGTIASEGVVEVAVADGYAYALDYHTGLWVLDVSDPTYPAVLAQTKFRAEVGSRLSVAGNLLAVARIRPELMLFDISDPTAPVQVGDIELPGNAYGVALAGGYAFVAAGNGGLRVVNLSDPTQPTESGAFNATFGGALAVTVAGAHAYVAAGSAGLRIIDISDPAAPEEVGYYNTSGKAYDVAVDGTIAFVADGGEGLAIIDVADPTAPVSVGSYNTTGEARGVAVASAYAYVADYGKGVRVIDVSDPARPVEVGYYDSSGRAYRVAVEGSTVYLATGVGVLLVLRANARPMPRIAAITPDPAEAGWNVSLAGGGSDPDGEIVGWEWELDGVGVGTGPHLALDGLAAGNHSVTLTVTDDHGARNSTARNLTVLPASGNHQPQAAIALDRERLHTGQVLRLTAQATDPNGSVAAYEWRVDGRLASSDPSFTLAGLPAGEHSVTLAVIDDQGGGSAAAGATFQVEEQGRWQARAGKVALLVIAVVVGAVWAWQRRGRRPADEAAAGAATTPRLEVGKPEGDTGAEAKEPGRGEGDDGRERGAEGGLADGPGEDPSSTDGTGGAGDEDDAGEGSGGPRVSGGGAVGAPPWAESLVSGPAPASAPAAARLTTRDDGRGERHAAAWLRPLRRPVWQLLAAGLVAALLLGVWPVESELVVGQAELPENLVNELVVVDGYGYLAVDNSGLVIFDLTDPTAPVRMSAVAICGNAWGVAVQGDYAYLACYWRVYVIDVSDPAVPEAVGSVETPGQAMGVAVAGHHLYVADSQRGLRVVDISEPTAPVEVGAVEHSGEARAVAAAGDYAYVAAYNKGLRVIDVSDSAAPVEVGTVDTPGTAEAVAVRDGYAYVADRCRGLLVIDVSDPAAPVVVGEYETPGCIQRVALAGSHAYVADGVGGLLVLDVTDPTAPELTFHYDPEFNGLAVAAADGYAWLTSSDRVVAFEVDRDGDGHLTGDDDYPGRGWLHAKWQAQALVLALTVVAAAGMAAARRWRVGEW